MKLTLERQIPIAFSIAILLLIVIVFFASRSMQSVSESLKLQSHTQEVLLQLDKILIAKLDTETNGRAFLITADPIFLEAYYQAESRIGQNIIKLRELVDDNQSQKDRIPKLETAINERLEILRNAVEQRRTKTLEEILAQNVVGRSREKMSKVRNLLEEMEVEERNLLAQRDAELIKNRNITYGLILFAGIAGIVSLGLANFAIFREITKRRSAEDNLRVANKDLEKRVEERTQEISQKNDELQEQIRQREYTENRHRLALNAGSLGTWMVNPHTNKSEIDERGLSLFGFTTDDFDGNAFGRVFEDDAERVREIFQKSISENQFFNVEFRVSSADGKIRWNNCVGQPVLDESGKVSHIVGNCRDITDGKETENLIRQSEIFRRAILDSLSAHIAVLDKSGEILAVNNAWEHFAEKNCLAEQIASTGIGQNYLKVCEKSQAFEADTKKIVESLSLVLEGKSDGFSFEYPCHAPDEERWFLLQVTSLKSEKGGAVVSHIDISDRKKAEESLQKQRENFHALVKATSQAVWTADDDGQGEDARQWWTDLTGQTFEESEGWGWLKALHPNDQAKAQKSWHHALETKTLFDTEYRIKTVDGEYRHFAVRGVPVYNINKTFRQWIGTLTDISARKKAEDELKNSEEFSRSVFENSPDCVKILELDGTLHSMNKNGLCIMEIEDFNEFAGKQWIDFWEDDENEMAYQAIRSAREGKTANFQGYCRTAKGNGKWWDVSVAPIFGLDGEPVRIISTSRDISERREAEREREELLKSEQAARKEAEIANRLRDEFLATVSHELRAPLNSILGWGKLLVKGNLDVPTADKAIQTIVRNAEAQNRLIEDLLDVSRIISGKLRLEIITIKPIIFVESALETVRPAADAKNITLEVKQDTVVSHISGDPNRLQQVVWNLLSNAIKFTPAGGKVTIEIERMNGHTEIRVKDTGAGISEEFLPHVFDRFRQADASSIRKFGGLGLGLAIVRHIVEMHGGTVSATSAGENLGSTFTVSLPVTSAPKDEENGEETSRSSTIGDSPKLSLDGLLILVVDDEEDTRQLLVQSLTSYGATVITAKSVEDGLVALQEKNPDVLVSDIGMPDEDGYTFIKKVRALENEQHKNTIAVALTAFTRAQDRMRALASGYQNHVGKPVELDELATVIASLTGRLKAD